MKQAIVVRQDLQLPKGKLAAQVAHASVQCFHKTNFFTKRAWLATGMKKVVLKVKDLNELYTILATAKQEGVTHALIADAGKTVVSSGTVTCLGIGPGDDAVIDKIVGSLKLL